jgi:hypothetical protein
MIEEGLRDFTLAGPYLFMREGVLYLQLVELAEWRGKRDRNTCTLISRGYHSRERRRTRG